MVPEKFFKRDFNVFVWTNFFDTFVEKNDVILDFGCGAGWGVYVGRNLNYRVYGLDIKYAEDEPLYAFEKKREELGVSEHIKLYNGFGRLPFKDNSFSLIVCRNSLMRYKNRVVYSDKDYCEQVTERVSEFERILNNNKTVIITSYGYGHETAKKLREKGLNIIRWNNKPLVKEFKILKEKENVS